MAAALLLGGLSLAAAQPVPIPAAPPIHAAAEYTRPLRSVPGGNLSAVAIPGATPYKLVHLHGSTEERGFAYGRLLHADIIEIASQMDDFYRSEVTSIPWAKLVHPPLTRPPRSPLVQAAVARPAPAATAGGREAGKGGGGGRGGVLTRGSRAAAGGTRRR